MRCVIEFQRVNGVSVQNSGHPNPKVHICRIAYTPRMLQCLHKSFYSHAQLSQLLDCWKIAFFYTIFHHVRPMHAAVSMLFRFSNLRKFRCDIFCTTCNSFERQVGITCFNNGGSISKHPTMMLHKRVRVECNFQLEYSLDAFPRRI